MDLEGMVFPAGEIDITDAAKSPAGAQAEKAPGYRPDAETVRDGLRAAYPQLGEISITGLGVVIGAHCGPGLLTVFYLCNGRTPE